MGKARILSAQGEGLYSIEILEDRTRAEAARTTAVQRVAQLDARITDLESDLADAQDEVDAAAAAQDQAIADYQVALQDDGIDTAASRQAMTQAGEALVEAAAARDAIRGHIRAAKAERLTLQARIERIDALPPLRQVDAWCADYVEDLSGEVATAEVPGEVGQVIIQPGFTDGAAWSPSEDGAIQPALSGTPASVFYNLAMMPGWQRWRPTFRIATISNIDNDLCSISLDAATSSQQGLDINAQSSYSGVPIMYMDCNGGAFEDGDRVLVAFSGNTDAPMVVGFEQEPKACDFKAYLVFKFNAPKEVLENIMARLEDLFFSGDGAKQSYNGFVIHIMLYHESTTSGYSFGWKTYRETLTSGVFLQVFDKMLVWTGGDWNTTHRYLGFTSDTFDYHLEPISENQIPDSRIHFFNFSRWFQDWDPYTVNANKHYVIRENVVWANETYGYTQFGYPSAEEDFTLLDFGGELGHHGDLMDEAVYSTIWDVVQDKNLLSPPRG